MISLPRLALALIILFNILPTFSSLKALQYGNELKDLYSVTGTCFVSEATTWSANQKFSTYVYNDPCGGYGIVGGANVLKAYGDYFYKPYSGLPDHTWIYYTMTIYALDSWSYGAVAGGDDHFGIQFDSLSVVDGFRFNVYTFSENICGVSWNDLRNVRVFGRIAHSSSTLTLKVLHLLDQDSNDESVAFREVNLIFAKPTASPGATMCGRAPFTGFDKECLCPEGQYGTGSCQNCHPNCESCWGPSASECFQCRVGTSWINGACTPCATGCASCHGTTDTDCDACLTGFYFYNSKSCIYPCASPLVPSTSGCTQICSSPCTTITDYIYWDGSCAATCPAPHRPNTINKYVKSCEFPCPVGSYLYWDGSCSTSCLAPLTQTISQGKLYCNYPCADGEFAFWNGTCSAICLPPLAQRYANGRQFCELPCGIIDYLYWNGSCITTCDFPLVKREVYGISYCDYPCKNSEFLYWDGTCETSCQSPLTTRVEGTRPRNFCDFKGVTTDYLYWDGTYHSSCDPRYKQSTFKGRSVCQYPCASTDFLYWNGSCLSSCDLPLKPVTTGSLQFCNFGCATQTDYLYWDATCSSSCDSPLTQVTIGGSAPRKLCTFTCTSTEVLYYNGTCLTSCTSPFVPKSQNARSICQYPCTYTEFLYYNGTCKDNCPFPFIPRKTNGVGFCDYPCSSTQYLFWNGSCMSACVSPLRTVLGPKGERWCNLPCDSPLDYYHTETGACKKTCDNRSVKQDDLYLICLPPDAPQEPQGFMDVMLTPAAQPESPSLLVPNRFTQYLKYLDVTLPTRLNTLSSTRARNIISLKINVKMPDSLQSFFTGRLLVSVAEEQGVSSSFVINFWGDIVFLVGVALFALVFQLLEKLSEKFGHFRSHAFFEKLRLITMWNLCFVLIGLNADDIIIYAYYEIRSARLTTPGGTVSLVIAIIMVVLVLGVVILGFYIAILFRVFRKEAVKKNKDDKCMEFHNGWKRFQVLYRGFIETSSLRQCFYMIYIIRTIIPQAILVGFVGFPFIQTVSQVAISGIMLAYLLFLNPLKKRINQIQLLCFEVAGLAVNIAALILTMIPANADGRLSSSHTRTFLGDMIILADLFINAVIIVFLVLKLVLEIFRLYKHFKANPTADKTVWLGLLVILIQQAAFGFEELMGENLLDIDPRRKDNPYGKSSVIFPEPTVIVDKSDEKPESLPTPSLIEKTNPGDEEAAPMRNKRRGITGAQRLNRMLGKKENEDDLSPNNASPTLELDLSPDSPGLGSKLGLNASQSKDVLKMESTHFEPDSPIKKTNTRLENLRLLKKKGGLQV